MRFLRSTLAVCASVDLRHRRVRSIAARPHIAVVDCTLIDDNAAYNDAETGSYQRERAAMPAMNCDSIGIAAISRADTAPAAALIAQLQASQDLDACNGCEREIGRKLGVERVGVCWVQKISNLILNINLRVEDVRSRRRPCSSAPSISAATRICHGAAASKVAGRSARRRPRRRCAERSRTDAIREILPPPAVVNVSPLALSWPLARDLRRLRANTPRTIEAATSRRQNATEYLARASALLSAVDVGRERRACGGSADCLRDERDGGGRRDRPRPDDAREDHFVRQRRPTRPEPERGRARFCSPTSPATSSEIDTATGKVVRRVKIGKNPEFVRVHRGYAYVTYEPGEDGGPPGPGGKDDDDDANKPPAEIAIVDLKT